MEKARASGLAFGIQFSRCCSAFARECLRRLIVNAGLPLVFQLQGPKRTAWPIVAFALHNSRSISRVSGPKTEPYSPDVKFTRSLSLSLSLSAGLAFYLICQARGLITRQSRVSEFRFEEVCRREEFVCFFHAARTGKRRCQPLSSVKPADRHYRSSIQLGSSFLSFQKFV